MYRRTAFFLLAFLCVFAFVRGEDTGHLQVRCEAGVAISLNGELKGYTSKAWGGLVLLDVPAGSYELKAVKVGVAPVLRQISVVKGDIAIVELDLPSVFPNGFGHIHFSYPAGITILLNDVEKGTTSDEWRGLIVHDIPAGRYEVKAFKDGRLVSVWSAMVRKGRITRFIAPLPPIDQLGKTGSLRVKGQPDVVILVDDVMRGVTSSDADGTIIKDIPVGRCTVKAMKAGRTPSIIDFGIEVSSERTEVVNIGWLGPHTPHTIPWEVHPKEAEPANHTGQLEIWTLPVSCTVTFPYTVTTLYTTHYYFANVPVGRHPLQLAYKDKTLSVTVEVFRAERTVVYANFMTMETSVVQDATLPVDSAVYAPLEGLFEGSAEAQERQRQWVEKGYPLEVSLTGTDIRFRLIPPGTFEMGAPDGQDAPKHELPQHTVTISRPFYLAVTETTQAQWDEVMTGIAPDEMGQAMPVNKGPIDTDKFIRKLRTRAHCGRLRLPSEAEWEYACRAGTTGSRYGELDSIAWHHGNSGQKVNPVRLKLANAWGLYDMLGNAAEWCEDNWHADYNGAPTDGSAWLGGRSLRVLRGGSWVKEGTMCPNRSTHRNHLPGLDQRHPFAGFRLALDFAPPTQPDNGHEPPLTIARPVRPDTGPTLPPTLTPRPAGAPTPTPEPSSFLEPVSTAQYAPLAELFAGSAEAQELQKEWVAKGHALEVKLKGTDIRFRLIPPGSFEMGSPDGEEGRDDDEGPMRRVSFAKPFYMAVTEVTQAQWHQVMSNWPSHFYGDDLPVEQVCWSDCSWFIKKLEASTKSVGIRLPTEAEWEYACRAGTSDVRYAPLDSIAWYGRNSGEMPHTVGQKLANAWGLHDMLGNVYEWCEDTWRSDYKRAPIDGRAVTFGRQRVIRGAGWSSGARQCRSAYRDHIGPEDRKGIHIGFRLVISLP